MVLLRFGSPTDFRFRRLTYAQVADRMKCWLINVYLTVQRFIKNGYEHPPDGRTVRQEKARPVISGDMIMDITSLKLLTEWAPLSLKARVILLNRRYPNHHISLDCLKRIYKQAKVKNTKREKRPWKSVNKPGLDGERRI